MASASADPSAASADAGPEVHVHVGTPPGKPPEDTELVARLESAIQSGGAQMLMQTLQEGDKLLLWKALQAAAPAKEQGFESNAEVSSPA